MSKILLVLGSGGRVGASVASLFKQKGYSIAIAARSLEDNKVNSEGYLTIKADLGNADSVTPTFEKVKAKFGGPPNVVVYNAAAVHPVPVDDPLTLEFADLRKDMVVNAGSLLVAAQHALAGFRTLPESASKSFIYTGNLLNLQTMPALLALGIGKSAGAHLIRVANEAYAGKGYHFYYADERKADGAAAFRDVNGPAHAEHYLTLAESKEPLPWLQTFVAGQGYKDFEKI